MEIIKWNYRSIAVLYSQLKIIVFLLNKISCNGESQNWWNGYHPVKFIAIIVCLSVMVGVDFVRKHKTYALNWEERSLIQSGEAWDAEYYERRARERKMIKEIGYFMMIPGLIVAFLGINLLIHTSIGKKNTDGYGG